MFLEEMPSLKGSMIILIGMPGAGKSTVGVVLAKRLGYKFIDSDIVIQEKKGKLLSQLIKEEGIEGFWKIENDINKEITEKRAIIATGGSAVYGREAMEHFKEKGTVVFLKLSYEEIENRLGSLEERGITIKEGQTLSDLYIERNVLYAKYADITVDCDGKMIRDIVNEIAAKVK